MDVSEFNGCKRISVHEILQEETKLYCTNATLQKISPTPIYDLNKNEIYSIFLRAGKIDTVPSLKKQPESCIKLMEQKEFNELLLKLI